jgi:hypothetical protein
VGDPSLPTKSVVDNFAEMCLRPFDNALNDDASSEMKDIFGAAPSISD